MFAWLGVMVVYGLVYSIAGRAREFPEISKATYNRKFAVFIPSYKEDEVILSSAEHALKQSYPAEDYDVVVIADSLKPETVGKLKNMPIKVIEVSFDLSTKARSLNKALADLPEVYDYALVLDADNLMERDFLVKFNNAFCHTNAMAIQGHRVAKNLNTNFAILDAVSEEVNNHIYRKGHRALGLSSGLIGSGMAFDYAYFKQVMKSIDAIGGFDKELEVLLNRDRVKIHYLESALVYDEKVENPEVFKNQRRRWMSAQIIFLKKYFLEGVRHLFSKGNIDFFDKVFQFTLLPRVMLLFSVIGLSVVAFFLNIFIGYSMAPGTLFWLGLAGLNVLSIFLAIPDKFYNKQTFRAALHVPKAVVLMFMNLFKLKGADKKFIHTPHSGSADNNV
ncbi:glycosyltransferase family 2 protein [Cytophagaceae bacterium ABcell3]|nr:glycosyltransferase family 2 protein [Cytophagaceae bacterium ABcell3]